MLASLYPSNEAIEVQKVSKKSLHRRMWRRCKCWAQILQRPSTGALQSSSWRPTSPEAKQLQIWSSWLACWTSQVQFSRFSYHSRGTQRACPPDLALSIMTFCISQQSCANILSFAPWSAIRNLDHSHSFQSFCCTSCGLYIQVFTFQNNQGLLSLEYYGILSNNQWDV